MPKSIDKETAKTLLNILVEEGDSPVQIKIEYIGQGTYHIIVWDRDEIEAIVES